MLAILLTTGCAFDEHLPQVDIAGTVVLPKAAATRLVTNPNTGVDEEIVDVRNIGPVVLGAFPSIQENLYDYPHPEMGPVLDPEIPGNTYPYGGGTVGRFDFACFEHLACKVSTGRFEDYQDVLDWWGETLHDPVVDEFGNEVASADYFQQYCYELFEVTADYELAFISGESGVDFVENSDGDFEADFQIYQIDYHKDMEVWGWVDTPGSNFSFATCNPENGQRNQEYVNDYYYGTAWTDILNFPGLSIENGDFVTDSDDTIVLSHEDADAFRAADETYTLRMDFQVGVDEVTQ